MLYDGMRFELESKLSFAGLGLTKLNLELFRQASFLPHMCTQ